MVLPAPVYAIKALGWAHALYFVSKGKHELTDVRREQVTGCSLGPPTVLIAYRFIMLSVGLAQGVAQLALRGPKVLIFATVWNWWLLTLFFAVASAVSLRAEIMARAPSSKAVQQSSSSSSKAAPSPQQPAADRLDRVVVVLFHIVGPMCFVVISTTWLVLVPSLLKSADAEQVKRWELIFYSFSSYMQHGFNGVMLLGELLLNRIPACILTGTGWMAVWASMFGVWSTVFYIRTGLFIYPFLEAHKPYAWVAYLALFVGHWIALLLFVVLIKGKHALGQWGERCFSRVKTS